MDWESLSLEELLHRLGDFLLQSGFESSYYGDWDDRLRSLEALREADHACPAGRGSSFSERKRLSLPMTMAV